MSSKGIHPAAGRPPAARRPHRVDRLDVSRFADEAATLEGQEPLSSWSRLRESVQAPELDQAEPALRWQLLGERRARQGEPPQVWLHLHGHAQVQMTCQRCLARVDVALHLQRSFRFVDTEAQAEQLDEALDDDVLVLHTAFDARTLVEDEALLALPLVPRHGVCPASAEVAARSMGQGNAAPEAAPKLSGSPDEPQTSAERALHALKQAWEQQSTPKPPAQKH
jgi:uncharacterized protein